MQPPKFTALEKAAMLENINKTIQQLPKMSQKVSRLEMRANRIYLYHLVEIFKSDNDTYTKPLIDDKYFEFIYARITLHDAKGDDCSVDWQRHNNQWMTLHKGTLAECINSIENDDCWF